MKFSNLTGAFVITSLFAASSSIAEPIDFPASLIYEENFDAIDPDFPDEPAFLGEEWSYIITDASEDPPFVDSSPADGPIGWAQAFISEFTPVENLADADAGLQVFTNPEAGAGLNGGAGPDLTTLPPIVPPQFLADLGFEGGWLINDSLGEAFDVNGDGSLFEMRFSATARVEFKNLPEHVAIDLDFLTAVGDSIDNVVNRNDRDGPFEVRVDGVTVFSQFSGSYIPPSGVGTLATNANFLGSYQETWNNNPAASLDDRAITAWRMDSAYDFSTGLSMSSIEHSADTLTIDFIHRLGGDPSEEYTAIDKVAITLLTEAFVPENQWPGGTTFTENFDETLDINFWSFEGWSNTEIFPNGLTELTGNLDGPGGVRNSPPDPEIEGDPGDSFPANFPLEPLTPSQSLNDLDPGFAGNWLVSNAGPGTAVLTFRDLPPHTGIRMGFKLAGGLSVDAADRFTDDDPEDDLFLDEANFAIRVDDEYRLIALVNGFDTTNSIFPAETEDGEFFDFLPENAVLATGANLSGFLREEWLPDPQSEDDRQSLGWVLDSAYDFTAVPQLQEIAHTADTITIEFLHANDGPFNDEFVGIDSFELELLGFGIEPPTPLIITGVDGSGLPSQVGITFGSTAGVSYQVERSTDLTDFTVISPTVGVDATGTSTTYTDTTVPADTPRLFYRVRERASAGE